ncbi:hypothetical protein Syun_028770 [Stephania yunnanensis]|uniref:Uncharacterized protein n=1 Tax=Stephania yunnanensis TaxID=152371 RepID=A0AAP0E4E8_9MAGN
MRRGKSYAARTRQRLGVRLGTTPRCEQGCAWARSTGAPWRMHSGALAHSLAGARWRLGTNLDTRTGTVLGTSTGADLGKSTGAFLDSEHGGAVAGSLAQARPCLGITLARETLEHALGGHAKARPKDCGASHPEPVGLRLDRSDPVPRAMRTIGLDGPSQVQLQPVM